MQLFFVFISSLFWGITNPFIRKASSGIEKIEAKNSFERTLNELKFLFTNINVNKIFIFFQKKSNKIFNHLKIF